MFKLSWIFPLALGLGGSALFAQNDLLVNIEEIQPQDVIMEGFRLDNDQDVAIEAVGLFHRDKRKELMLGTAWILNAETREVVWHFEPETERTRRFHVQEQQQTIRLPQGYYEAYYASFPNFIRHDVWSGGKFGYYMGRLFDELFSRDYDVHDYEEHREMFREFRLSIRGSGEKLAYDDIKQIRERQLENAIVSIAADHDNIYEKRGFELKKEMKLKIYALGEARDDGEYDYGWIIDADTGDRVWQFSFHSSDRAGGASKNRLVKEEISLDEGRYAAIYITDDSHSPSSWNSAPPFDPAFWGMTILLDNPNMRKHVKEFDYEGFQERNSIVLFKQVRDDEFLTKGFTLKKPLNLRIYALGEGRDGEMFDYGWIVEGKSGKRVWSMDYHDTEHAGGTKKNRIVDEIVHFDRGDYIAYFVTDGSHSFRDWNASPPYDPEHWGMTIIGADDDFNPNHVTDYEKEDDPNILASLVRVRDDAYERANFTLKKDSKVHIYAIGEGSRGRMYDYGWIEDANSGRVVWEMTYRMTDHAGGASKNRVFDGTLTLERGDYRVYFESDGSHSFKDWNASPPRDQLGWGITIRFAED